jgi:NodT family efflux transporter outer membrane factor (OMF) lipoprotein
MLWLIALSACASSPAYQAPPVEVPSTFRETSVAHDTAVATVPSVHHEGSAPDPADWQELGDTTLTRLVHEVLNANLDVRTAEARVRGARAARTSAVLELTPTVNLGAGYTRQRLSSASFPGTSGPFPDQDVWDAGFDASWEFDLFGRLRRNISAQGAFEEASSEDLRNVQVFLTAELARSYFELRGAQERLAVARSNAENQKRTLEVTQERLDNGRGTAFDTERAKSQLGSTLASIPTFEAQVAAAQYRIGVLVGRPPAQVAGELDAVVELPELPDTVPLAAPDSLIRRRPDVGAAERQLAGQQALVGAAKAEYLPRIVVGGGAGYTSSTFEDLTGSNTFRYAVGPVVSLPLNWGRIKANVDITKAQADEAQAQYTQTVLQALQDVETALSRYRSSRSRVERLREAAVASAAAAELARLRFSEGVTDFLQVLDAERTQLDAEDQLAQGRTDAATAYAALYKALGGSWPFAQGS